MKRKTGFLDSLTPEEAADLRRALDLDRVVITGPGKYRTRDGRIVSIRKTTSLPPYSCVGAIVRGGSGGTSVYLWAPSGRYRAMGEHPYDIVEKA